jgi:hypothetical protein
MAAKAEQSGFLADADRFIARFLAYLDDPSTCSFATLHFTRGRVPA